MTIQQDKAHKTAIFQRRFHTIIDSSHQKYFFGNYNGMMNGDTSLLQVLFLRRQKPIKLQFVHTVCATFTITLKDALFFTVIE